ncbi:head GIN domain-containing protein [Telluribacter sp. SYSU D00476]|uniref:head GIN domain-containing protein n=1 Tax=Telluribacter sp. SYSU D00476 TaxID=2811430 RepID=UPI001FF6EE77|nr:head GIN domain-containing protein [Telluribacter sp. SYSU D00476]
MKKSITSIIFSVAILSLLLSMQSCLFINSVDNISPRGVSTREISLIDFDRLEMGNAFRVRVRQGNTFKVVATGELNDLDDLDAFVDRNGLLTIRYRNHWRSRRDRMDIDITMPSLRGVRFSGAAESTIEGFEDLRVMDVNLSGASRSTFTGSAERFTVELSGASELNLRGEGRFLTGDMSGASDLRATDYPVEEADLHLSGASRARVSASKYLKVDASGASNVRYRGNPTIEQRLSGGSNVNRD